MIRTPPQKLANLSIIGAGCAGLSLARKLVQTEKTSGIKACLYGPVSTPQQIGTAGILGNSGT